MKIRSDEAWEIAKIDALSSHYSSVKFFQHQVPLTLNLNSFTMLTWAFFISNSHSLKCTLYSTKCIIQRIFNFTIHFKIFWRKKENRNHSSCVKFSWKRDEILRFPSQVPITIKCIFLQLDYFSILVPTFSTHSLSAELSFQAHSLVRKVMWVCNYSCRCC